MILASGVAFEKGCVAAVIEVVELEVLTPHLQQQDLVMTQL